MERSLHYEIASLVDLLEFLSFGRAFVDCLRPSDVSLWGSERGDFGKLFIVAGNGLDECAQVGPRHTEDKGPVLTRIQVAVGQDEQALVRLRRQLVTHDHVEQVLGVELLALRVKADSSLNQLVDLEVLEVQLDGWPLVARGSEAGEEDLDVVDELVDQSLVERVREEGLLRPKLHDFDVLDLRHTVPVLDLSAVVLRVGLGHLLAVLSQPVALRVALLQLELFLYCLVDLFAVGVFEGADELLEVLKFVHGLW